ncbi:ABC transporter ATP-binding protein [Sphingomonas sp. Leaf24]|uniref:ABC transporter transmembrane domain-containing protein n=1 Tax=unclassified Sphingomonas TaxID=196159 RepID=UPI0006FD4C49|nr:MULTISPECIES: ABC transporter transmembrane domain-containing protein [unclassified Sphingomonas]KQM23275.1 ABC transporter ATP-binding protein [Sphingomonas sp. Leaf5]KQM96134.1 ABC transporter ATP-binding protein [Sphingomonas sp. Leaf24]
MATQRLGFRDAIGWLSQIIGPDSAYVRLGIVYTVAISLLALATPISVQLLINSVANTAMPAPLWALSGVLLLLLLMVVALSALRVWIMAGFERRLFSRIVAEVTLRAVHAQDPFFTDGNRGDLFNRFFDLVVVQKSVPSLVIGAFTIVLQAVIGLTITSFYHPVFLAFNVVLVAAIFMVWLIWRRGAIGGAVALSHAKHKAAHWLESVGGSNGFYKSSRHLDFAMQRSEAVTASYVDTHRRYFRYQFAQTVAFLLIYAFASAGLLLLGGMLILRGQLSLGQLVAAELILSGVFYGISQFGWYLDSFYELVASSEELSLLFAIPQETTVRGDHGPRDGAVKLTDVVLDGARYTLALGAGEQLVTVAEPGAERRLAMLLKRHALPERGLLRIGGADPGSFDIYRLRSDVTVLDRSTIVEATIRQYLRLASEDLDEVAMEALATVGLERRLASLPKGLDTQLGSTGYPLSVGETMALKLANALLVRPKLLLLGQLYDLLPPERLAAALRLLKAHGTTVLLCTGRPEDLELDGYLHLGMTEQRRFDRLADLQAAGNREGADDASA